jgi:hypothetical protein
VKSSNQLITAKNAQKFPWLPQIISHVTTCVGLPSHRMEPSGRSNEVPQITKLVRDVLLFMGFPSHRTRCYSFSHRNPEKRADIIDHPSARRKSQIPRALPNAVCLKRILNSPKVHLEMIRLSERSHSIKKCLFCSP